MDIMVLYVVPILAGMFRTSPALLLPALGEAMSERSGVFNVGLEGYMLTGALAGYYGTFFTGSPWVGVLAGVIAGLILSLVHAYLCVTHKTNQILSGIAIWIFAIGFTAFLFRAFDITIGVNYFGSIKIPILSSLPFLGPIFFQQNIIFYISIILVLIFAFVIYRTPFGLVTRGTGDSPLAVDMAGHNVFAVRYVNVLVCGAMAGFGGAYMSIVVLDRFIENMTAGRGFVALALVIFGNWNPLWILGGTLIFTLVDAFQIQIQAAGAVMVPYPFLLMLPYVVAIIILAFSGRKATGATKLFIPYTKGED